MFKRRYSDSEIDAILEENRLLKQKDKIVDEFLIITKTDPKGVITYVNQAFVKISGFSKEELIGKPHNIVRHPDVPKGFYKKIWQTIKDEKQIWRGVFKNRAKDGTTYYVESSISPIFNLDGELVEYIALRKDITKRIKREKELSSEKRFTSKVLNYQDSIILLTNEEQGLLDVNQKFFEYVDFNSISEFKKYFKCIGDLFVPEEEMVYSCAIDWIEYIYSRRDRPHKAKMIDKNGKVKYFSIEIDKITASPSRVRKYNLKNKELYIMTLHDVTDLEFALQKARAGMEAKSRFLANMSHEIRTPLNGVLGFAELLKKTPLTPEQKKYVSTITSSSKTLLGIINDILDFSKVESGNMSLEYIKFNPIAELEPTLSLFSAKMIEKRISYILYIDPRLPRWIYLDPLRLKQVISNLIGNAFKFTPENGTVKIDITFDRVDEKNINLHISVQDSGIGISPEQQKRIFTPFSQADESTTRKFGGTGLGLSISKSFVELMGGKLELESQEGRGSRFFFTIKTESYVKDEPDYGWLENQESAIYVSDITSLSDEVKVLEKYLKRFGLKITVTSDMNSLKDVEVVWIISMSIIPKDLDALNRELVDSSVVIIDGYDKSNRIDINAKSIRRIDFPFNMSTIYEFLIDKFGDRFNRDESQEIEQKEVLNFEGANILVAEDNEVNQMFIELLLKEYGVSLDIADNGEDAVKMVQEKDYDLVFMDVNMPVLGGVEATKMIRELEAPIKDIPIIALTANAMVGDKEKFLSAGMNDYIKKPVDIGDLEKILLKYLSNKK